MKKKKLKHSWADDFYIRRKDMVVMYLYFVVCKATKKEVAGGFSERQQAVSWLKNNWKQALETELEEILLVNQ